MSPYSSTHCARIGFKTLMLLSVVCGMLFFSSPSNAYAKEGGLLAFFLPFEAAAEAEPIRLASNTISLEKRYANDWVNNVFKDNILLTLAYMSDAQTKSNTPDWSEVQKPFTYQFTLKPGEVFAFHDAGLLPKYAQNVTKTTNAHFSGAQGFRSSGKLMGDGVCHLASLFYWVALDAGLEAKAPVNHDFAPIPEIDKKYGVAIYTDFANPANSMNQNLYIRNNQDESITFNVIYNGKDLTIEVLKKA